MVRPFRSETERYGEYSKAGEFVYDHPFLWGSKRTGPDLHRVGGKYPDAWHFNHMEDPRSTSPGSIMPAYPWLLSQKLDASVAMDRMRALRKVGVPYTDEDIKDAVKSIDAQSKVVVANLAVGSVTNAPADREIVALIAYLQRLGKDIKANPQPQITNVVATAQLAR
jgi:cytochrome c oxidase cbb3-type subunit I/II